MALVFSIPAKTFLLGEYLALNEGPALVALTSPCFELKAIKGTGSKDGIHSDSPAGKFITAYSDYFLNYDLSFFDPYQGKGGFGASTAQFLGVYSLWLHKEEHQQDMEKLFDYRHLLDTYKRFAWNGQGLPPSGADLMAQLKGSMTYFEKRRGLLSSLSWPFADLEFALIHTGHKVATHEHLRDLKSFDSDLLESAFELAKESFENLQAQFFVDAVKNYAEALKKLNFTCENSLRLLEVLRTYSGVRAAKGCGALGSDVLFVVVEKGMMNSVNQFCADNNLSLIATNQDVSLGLQTSLRENL